jgi:hypothetical protein
MCNETSFQKRGLNKISTEKAISRFRHLTRALREAFVDHLSTMRSTLLRFAESVTTKPLNLREASATLLPPKPCVAICPRYKVRFDESQTQAVSPLITRTSSAAN